MTAELDSLMHPKEGEPGLTHPDNVKRRQELKQALGEALK